MAEGDLGKLASGGSIAADTDADGLDMIVVTGDFSSFTPRWHMRRLALEASTPARVTWGGYMGSLYDGTIKGM